MKIKFDYLKGPVLGHKRRCEILKNEFANQGHSIVNDHTPDLLVADYPSEQFPESQGEYRLVMGILPQEVNDWAWHPLGPKGHKRTLYGGEYIIVNPLVKKLSQIPKQKSILITCGGADPFYLSEQLLNLLPEADIVIGPHFNRKISVDPKQAYYSLIGDDMIKVMSQYEIIVCAWGGTTFEALALGAKVLPITINDTYKLEAIRLGMSPIEKEFIKTVPDKIASLPVYNYGIDGDGAKRTVLETIKQFTHYQATL